MSWKKILKTCYQVSILDGFHNFSVLPRFINKKLVKAVATTKLNCSTTLSQSTPPPCLHVKLSWLTTLVQERAAVVNRLKKTLEWANIKLACVVTDVTGVSARQILAAIVDGQSDFDCCLSYVVHRSTL